MHGPYHPDGSYHPGFPYILRIIFMRNERIETNVIYLWNYKNLP